MAQSERIIRHKVLNYKGMSLSIPAHLEDTPVGGFTDVDIYAETSGQLFPLGTKLEFADGRLFRYGKFGATASSYTLLGRLLASGNLVPGSAATVGYEGSLDATSDYAVGSTTLVLNDTTDRTKNHYEDGLLVAFTDSHFGNYRILGNDAATSVDDVTIYLEDGLCTACVVNSTGVTAYPSIFSNLMNPNDCTNGYSYSPCIGICLASSSTATYYAWIQRRGLVWITPTAYYGDNASERDNQMHVYGESALKDSDTSQRVGYLAQMTVSGYGDGVVFLQLE